MSFYKENLDIRQFGGIISKADAIDIPIASASDSDHVDGDAPEGQLQGIPTSASTTGLGVGDTALGAWIKASDGTWNWVYSTGAAIYTHKDWYGTPASTGLTTAKAGTSFVVNNQEAHIACGTSNEPQWFGYIPYGHLGGSATGWYLSDSKIVRTSAAVGEVYIGYNVVGNISGGESPFDKTKIRTYSLSMVYDYTQESPLQPTGLFTTSIDFGLADYTSVTVKILINTVASMNKRITSCRLYYSDADSTNPSDATLYRLLAEYDITSASGWTIGGTYGVGNAGREYTDTGADLGGATYEQMTGIAENLATTNLKYTLNTSISGYHFVANCQKDGIPDANLMLFRSQAYRFDTFNWSQLGEFLKLPTVPTALVSYNNRIWAFDENRIYKIDPYNMVLEDITEGIGCLSQKSIAVTDYGMFWCDAKNAYWHDGSTILPIGDAIKTTDISKQWHGSATTSQPTVVFYPLKNTVLFGVPDAAASHYWFVWAFNIVRKRWDKWSQFEACTSGTSSYMFTGKNGELYCSTGSALTKPLGGSSTRACYWTSKEIDFDAPSQKKRISKFSVLTPSTETLGITYTLDSTATTTTISQSSPVVPTFTNVYKCKIKISCDATEACKSASIQYRNFEGNR